MSLMPGCGEAGAELGLTVQESSGRLRSAAMADGFDACGSAELANVAVGAPFVGLTAACLGFAQLSRLLYGKTISQTIDYDLGSPTTLSSVTNHQLVDVGNIGYQAIRTI